MHSDDDKYILQDGLYHFRKSYQKNEHEQAQSQLEYVLVTYYQNNTIDDKYSYGIFEILNQAYSMCHKDEEALKVLQKSVEKLIIRIEKYQRGYYDAYSICIYYKILVRISAHNVSLNKYKKICSQFLNEKAYGNEFKDNKKIVRSFIWVGLFDEATKLLNKCSPYILTLELEEFEELKSQCNNDSLIAKSSKFPKLD